MHTENAYIVRVSRTDVVEGKPSTLLAVLVVTNADDPISAEQTAGKHAAYQMTKIAGREIAADGFTYETSPVSWMVSTDDPLEAFDGDGNAIPADADDPPLDGEQTA
jgi:hypothetical protein